MRPVSADVVRVCVHPVGEDDLDRIASTARAAWCPASWPTSRFDPTAVDPEQMAPLQVLTTVVREQVRHAVGARPAGRR